MRTTHPGSLALATGLDTGFSFCCAAGSVLAIDTYENGERLIRIWNARTGKETLKIETDPDYFPPWFLSPDGKVLITRDHSRTSGHPEKHVLYDTATGKAIKSWNAAGNAAGKEPGGAAPAP